MSEGLDDLEARVAALEKLVREMAHGIANANQVAQSAYRIASKDRIPDAHIVDRDNGGR